MSPQCVKLYLTRPGALLLSPYRAGSSFEELRRALRQRHDWHCVLELHHSLGPAPAALDDFEDDNPFSVLHAEQPCPHAAQPARGQRSQATAPNQPRTRRRRRRQHQYRRPSNVQSTLTCMSWNAQGLTTDKVDELIDLATASGVDIIAVQETWEGTCRLTLPANAPFKWISKPRRGEQGQHGGVAFLVHTTIAEHVTPLPSADDHEVLWIKIQGRGGRSAKPIMLASAYMPDAGKSAADIEAAWDALKVATVQRSCEGQVVIVGDLNAKVGSASRRDDVIGMYGEPNSNRIPNAPGHQMLRFLRSCGMVAMNGRDQAEEAAPAYTHIRSGRRPGSTIEQGVLDYVVVSREMLACKQASMAVLPAQAGHLAGSDHLPVLCCITRVALSKTQPQKVQRWQVKRFLDKEHGKDTIDAYQAALAEHVAAVKQDIDAARECLPTAAALRRQAITELTTNIILHIKTAAEQVVGRTRVIPGRCQPWMDRELRAAIKLRRQLFTALKDAITDEAAGNSSEGDVDAADLAYTQQRKQVRKLVKAKKVALARAMDAAINRAWRKRVSERSVLGEKEMWHMLHRKLGRAGSKTAVQAVCNPATNCVEVSDAGIAEAFAQHSRSVGSSAAFARDTAEATGTQFDEDWYSHVTQQVAGFASMPADTEQGGIAELDCDVSDEEVWDAMRSLKNGKAGCPTDGLVNELLKYGGMPLAEMLAPFMQLILDCSTAPEQFLEGVIIYLHKKGDPKVANNYRGITLLSVVGKLTNKVIANRLISAAEEHALLHEAQNAFRPGRSTDDHIFTLSQLLRGRKNRNQRTYAFFLDLHKAYDTVWRDGLLYVLWQKGIRGKLWHYIRDFYCSSKRRVQYNRHLSKCFCIDMGVAQGDTLSCILFDFYIDGLVQQVYEQCPGLTLQEQAKVSALLFADDFTGFATTPSRLQQLIDVVFAYCKRWRLRANIESGKSTVLVFHPAGTDQHSPELQPVQDDIVYRGQQAQPAPQVQAAQLLAGAGQEQVAYRGQQAQPAPQAQAVQLLAGGGQEQVACRGQQAQPASQAQAAQLLAGDGQEQELRQEAVEVVAEAVGLQQQGSTVWMWGSQQLPQDTDYRYLGIHLSDDCGWKKHTEVLKDKCLKMKGMLAGIFKNKCLDTDVKRIMLLAVVRPVVEYGATVWHANAPQQAALESVQHQILSSMTGCPNTTSAHILRLETGCRSFESWADQRKLEYFYKLQNMPDDRLPKLVWQHNWQEGRRRGGQVKMWDAHTQEVARSVGMEHLADVCADVDSYGAYKKQVSMAVRQRDMQVVQADASAQSTLARYLPMLGSGVTEVPNTMQPYLAGIGPTVRTKLKLQFRSGTAAVAHRKELVTRHSRRHEAVSKQCPCCGHADETHQHAVLHCPQYAALRELLREQLVAVIGEEKVLCWERMSDEQKYQTILSDSFWGDTSDACTVDFFVQEFLFSLWDARQLVLRGQSASNGAGPHGQPATGTAQ